MPLLNYTTTISADKTVAEIQKNLASHGATAILCEYDNGSVKALSFKVETPHGILPFRLPVNYDAVLQVLTRDSKVPRSLRTKEQAVKVCWRILKDWVEAQVAIFETEMVPFEQVFLPYLLIDGDKTLYDRMISTKFLLGAGQSETL